MSTFAILSWIQKSDSAQIWCVLQYKTNFFIFCPNFQLSCFFDHSRARRPLLVHFIEIAFSLFPTLWCETYTFFYSYHISLFFLPLSYETVTFALPFFSQFSFCFPLWYDTHTFFWCLFITWAILLIFSNTLVRNGYFFMCVFSFYLVFVTTLARNAYFQLSCRGLIPFFITTLVRFAYFSHLSCTFLYLM